MSHAIVFIHGLFGGPGHGSTATFPFQNFVTLMRCANKCDTFTITYPTKASAATKLRLAEIPKELSEQLDPLANYRTIHLVGHSMGGNAILVSLMSTKFLHEDAHERFTKYKNVILLGTPIEGNSLANFRWLVDRFILLGTIHS